MRAGVANKRVRRDHSGGEGAEKLDLLAAHDVRLIGIDERDARYNRRPPFFRPDKRRGEVSQWQRRGIKDEPLATQAAAIERNQELDAAASRRKLRELIEATYTLPAQ